MLEIVAEFSKDIYYVEHFHYENCVDTLVFSGQDGLHHFQNDCQTGFYKIKTDLLQIALQFLEMHRPLTLLEDITLGLESAAVTNLMLAGEYLIGIVNLTKLAFFNHGFKSALLQDNFSKDVLSSITKTFDLSYMLNSGHFIVRMEILGLKAAQNLIVLSKDLFLALFGLETYKRQANVLLVFLDNGHIWYLVLTDLTEPQFLYSLTDSCVKVYVNKANDCLILHSKNKVVSFVVNSNLLDIKEKWKENKNDYLENFCHNASFCDDKKKLTIEKNVVMTKKEGLSETFSCEEEINSLRKSLNQLCLQKNTLKQLINLRLATLKEVQPLANLSADTSDIFIICFSATYVEVKLKQQHESCLPFYIVFSSKNNSRTFCSDSISIKVSLDITRCFDVLFCLFYQNEIWITSNVINCLPSVSCADQT